MTILYGSRRADTKGYLEFIWIENGTEHPQACEPKRYAASCGTWSCQGDTVAEVLDQLLGA